MISKLCGYVNESRNLMHSINFWQIANSIRRKRKEISLRNIYDSMSFTYYRLKFTKCPATYRALTQLKVCWNFTIIINRLLIDSCRIYRSILAWKTSTDHSYTILVVLECHTRGTRTQVSLKGKKYTNQIPKGLISNARRSKRRNVRFFLTSATLVIITFRERLNRARGSLISKFDGAKRGT